MPHMSRRTTHNGLFHSLLLGIAATFFAGCAAGPTTRINAGELSITFKEGEQNPEINGIEIIAR